MLTSEERENTISELWESGKYSTQKELSKILGIGKNTISELLRAKSIRENLNLNLESRFSTRTILDISPLPKIQQVKVLKKVKDIDKS